MFELKTIYGKIKAFLFSVGVGFILLFLVLVFYKSKLEKQIVQSSAEQFNSEVNSLVNLNSSFMIETVSFYSFWDEFVTAIRVRNTKWISENITNISYYQYDYICIYNTDIQIVKEFSLDSSIPSGFIPTEAVRSLFKARRTHYYYNSPAGLMEVSAASVHPTNDPEHKNTEPKGYLIIARLVDKDLLAQLSAISGSKISILRPDEPYPSSGNKTVVAKVDLNGWDGKLTGRIVFSRDLDVNFSSTNIIMIVILAFVIVVLFISNLFSRKFVNKPLSLVTSILTKEDSGSIMELKKAPDEYGHIGSLFEEYVLQKEELKIAKEKAEQADRLKSAFLANMSHEIRTPMNAIVGFSELVEFEPDQVKRHQYVKIIQNSSLNLLNLIVGIVDLSKIETGAIQLNYSNFKLSDMFAELKDVYSVELQKRDRQEVKLEYLLHDSLKVIHSDKHLIHQIISNLIGNAVKFTISGKISFDCIKVKDELIFSVSDTGTGIPDEDQKKIFDRFTKFDYHGMNNEGTGIGLSIVEKLVSLLNGKIWLKSVYGKGSTFYFSIPFIPPTTDVVPESLKKPHKSHDSAAKKSGKSILVVEDDKESFMLIKELLSPLGIIINHVGDGKEAVEFVKENPQTHLILMDMKLPFMNGDDATRAIRKFNRDIYIIAQTAYAMVGDREKAIDAGCNDYLTKPVDSKTLREMVSMYLLREN